ncbi:hypothetical protein ACJ41O_013016 [Fusarium nematophilum]
MSASVSQHSPEGRLRPRLSKLTMVAMTFAILNTWIVLGGTVGLVMPSGGSVALLYGFVFCVLCNLALAASLGELAAIWPTAGGQYHFIFVLSTEKWRKLLSFCAAWINIAGWLTLVTTEGFLAAQFVSAAGVVASNGRYVAEAWKTYLIFLAILTFSSGSNIFCNRILGAWNNLALYWSIMSVIIISIILLSMSDKTDADFVFTNFTNETGWSDGMSWMLGLLQPALSLIGFDAVLHMTEEMPMVATPTGMPLTELALQATGSRAAACIMSCMMAICFVHGTNGSVTSASRLLYAMARDRGIIFHNYFSHINPTLEVPVRTIMLSWVFNVLFGLLYLGPVVAFNAFVASCTVFLNVSYAFPLIVLLIRGRKILAEHQSPETPWKLDYISAVIGVFLIFLTGYWLAYGKTFEGPDVNMIIGQTVDLTQIIDDVASEEKKIEGDTCN